MNNQGQPLCFLTDNGEEFSCWSYVNVCDSAGIRREYTAPVKPQQKRSGRECDLVRRESRPCDPPGDSVAFAEGRSRSNPQHRAERQSSVAGDRFLGCWLIQPLSDQGKHRVAVAARGVLLAAVGPAGGAVLPGKHNAGGPPS